MTIPENKAIGHKPNSPIAPPPRGTNWLLVIGIDKYADADVPTLKNAVLDTQRLTKILTNTYGFHLFRALHDENATRLAVLDAVEELEKTLKEADNLVIFFSGHGYRKSKSGYIVPFEGRNDRTTDYISFADLNARIDELPMHHFLFILDCCYAGSSLKKLGEKLELNKPSRRILAASSPDETADDGFYGRNSPFTSALAEILEQNDGEELPVKTLHVQLRDLMDTKGVRQVPVEGSWRMDSNRDGEFIFLKKDVQLDAWQSLDKMDKNALTAFMGKYPKSPFLSEATAFIQEIEAKEAKKRQIDEANRKLEAEKAAFERAKKSGTKDSLSHFIFDYPLSIYRSEARKLLEIAEEAAAWKEAIRKNSLSAFLDFQEIYGTGQFGNDCQERINSFRKPSPTQPSAPILAPSPTYVETPKPPVVVATTKVETAKPVVDKPKEKEPQVIDGQTIVPNVEPYFFTRYKIFLIVAGILAAALIWYMVPKNQPRTELKVEPKVENSTPSVIQPQTPFFDVQKFNNLLKDVDGALEAEDHETAKKQYEEARRMSPNHPDLEKYRNRFKK